MSYFERVIRFLSRWLNVLACCALLFMATVACVNMITRVFGKPFFGTFEVVKFLGVAAVSFALAQTQVKRGYISLSVIVSRFGQRKRLLIESLTHLGSSAIIALCAWRTAILGTRIWTGGELSEALKIPVYPLIYATAFCLFILSVVLLIDFLKSLAQVVKK